MYLVHEEKGKCCTPSVSFIPSEWKVVCGVGTVRQSLDDMGEERESRI